jgi:hypothetical protein
LINNGLEVMIRLVDYQTIIVGLESGVVGLDVVVVGFDVVVVGRCLGSNLPKRVWPKITQAY